MLLTNRIRTLPVVFTNAAVLVEADGVDGREKCEN